MSSKSSTTTSSSKVMDQWIHSTIHHTSSTTSRRPYLTLIQSTCSYQTRQTAVAGNNQGTFHHDNHNIDNHNEEEVYRRARVRTPSANAQRDMTGGIAGLFYLLDHVLLEKEHNDECQVIWVSTTNSILLPSSLHYRNNNNIQIVNVANNPIGWDTTTTDIDDHDDDDDNEQGEEHKEFLSMMNLQSISNAIRQKAHQPQDSKRAVIVVFESLTPLLVLHGVTRLVQWFQSSAFTTSENSSSSNNISHILLPVFQQETLTSWQHRQLEDIAQALLYFRNGEMTLLRQGVRDKSNIVRHAIPFRFDYDSYSSSSSSSHTTHDQEDDHHHHDYYYYQNWIPIVLEQDEDTVPLEEQDETETHPQEETHTHTTTIMEKSQEGSELYSSSSSKPRSGGGRTKVTLQHQHDNDARPQPSTTIVTTTTTTTKQQLQQQVQQRPQIYIQDDDPEYHDFDEDDPDDDLDI